MTEITSGEGRGTGNICQDILQHRSQEAHPRKNNDQHWVKGIPRNWTMIHENIPFKWVQESIRLQERFLTTEKDDQNAKQILRDG